MFGRFMVEKCEGGFIIELQVSRSTKAFINPGGQIDFKRVITTWPEVEKYMQEFFIGQKEE